MGSHRQPLVLVTPPKPITILARSLIWTVNHGVPGKLALMTPATNYEEKIAERPVLKTSGVSGLTRALVLTEVHVEDTSPGPVIVSKETVLFITQSVLESLPRGRNVITLTKVIFIGFISFTDGTCRYSDHRLQPGRDVLTFYSGDILATRHPRQTPS